MSTKNTKDSRNRKVKKITFSIQLDEDELLKIKADYPLVPIAALYREGLKLYLATHKPPFQAA